MNLHLFARAAVFSALGIALQNGSAAAQTPPPRSHEAVIQYANRRFKPTKLEVAAGEPLLIRVVNRSQERIEFESFRLHRERVVDPGATIIVRVGALKPGTYDFFDDFHAAVPEGEIVALSSHP